MLSRMSLNSVSKTVPKSQRLTKNNTTNRSLHVICQNRIISVPNVSNCRILLGQNFIRHASTEILDTFQIPAPPITSTIISDSPVLPEKISELAAAGLGTSWTPVSFIQHTLEYLHSNVGLPWWGAIIAVTVVARIASFPLIIRAQRHMSNMSEYMPEFQETQKKLLRARLAGDSLAVEKYAQELALIMKGRELDSFKGLYPAFLQGSIAISIFLALDRMTRAPLKSMQEGGLSWFTDLCVPDPYMILPLTSSTTLMLLLYGSSKMMPIPETTKKVLVGILPCVTFLFVKTFPAGTLVYWVTTNSLTLCQHELLKLPKVKKYFNLKDHPAPIKNPSSDSPGLVEIFRQNMDNVKITQQIRERLTFQDLERRRSLAINKKKAFKEDKKSESSKAIRKDGRL